MNVHVVVRKTRVIVGGNSPVEVHVPVVVNRRKVRVGDELLLLRAPCEKQPAVAKRTLNFKENAKAKAKPSPKP